MSYVYRRSPQGEGFDLFTVGHYMPTGDWVPESDHATEAEAARRVSYLNGGGSADEIANALALQQHLRDLGASIWRAAAHGCPCCEYLAESMRALGYELPPYPEPGRVDVEPDHSI